MRIRSLLQSTKLELATSKKFTLGLYALFGGSILFWWGIATKQFLEAYFELGEFDLTVGQFLFATLFTFMILVTSGAYMLSIVILRIRQYYWMKKMLSYTGYDLWLNPASAGFVVDYEYSNEETWATLFHLRNKGMVKIDTSESRIIIYDRRDGTDIKMYEKSILDSIFGNEKVANINDPNSYRITSSGTEAHRILASAMHHKGFEDSKIKVNKTFTFLLKLFLFMAGVIGVRLLYFYIFKNEVVSEILYPRYDVHPIQIMSDAAVWVVAICVILSGFWPRFNYSEKNDANTIILQALGFKRYLNSVYKPKFKEHSLRLLSKSDLTEIGPYMFAFKLAPLNKSYIIKYINLCNGK